MSENNAQYAVLFDLDGTLVDTAKDLAYALNRTLEDFGRKSLPFEKIRPVVSHGGTALIKLGFDLEPDHPDFEKYRQHLLRVYQENLCRESVLFEGMDTLLEYLESNNMHWGIVTNKPSWLTDPLMSQMGLDKRAASIVSGDTCENNKPHPEPILFACEQADLKPETTFYIGDALRDIEAGNAAGCITVSALFGYIQEHDVPEQWPADHIVNHPLEIIDLLKTTQTAMSA